MNNSLLNVETDDIENTSGSNSYDSIKLNSSPESNTNTDTNVSHVSETNKKCYSMGTHCLKSICNPFYCLHAIMCLGFMLIISVIIYAIIYVPNY